MDLRIIYRDGERIRLSEAKQGDQLTVFENVEAEQANVGTIWEVQSDAFLPDLTRPDFYAVIGTTSKL